MANWVVFVGIMAPFSCVFVLFQVMSWLFSIPLRTANNTKTQENVSVCNK